MKQPTSFGKMQFDVSFGPAGGTPRDPGRPFVLAVVGDFSGRANRGVAEPIGARRVWRVDCDNFETILSKLDARLKLPLAQSPGETIELRFECVEDFHPDQLIKQAGPLSKLLDQRRRLLNPATSAAAGAELQRQASQPSNVPAEGAISASPGAAVESSDETMARLLGGAPLRPAVPATQTSKTAVGLLLKQAVAASVVPAASAEQTALVSAVEMELAAHLRAILHHPDFQALEAAWRGLHRLVRNFGGEENVELSVLDISKDEMATDLAARESLESSEVFKVIRRQADELPWSVWVGLYTFGDNIADAATLGRIGKISAHLGAPFLAGASPHLMGCDSFDLHRDPDDWRRPISDDVRQAWNELRQLPEAGYVGLALPRFLLRQPYGKDSDPVESFAFEELPGMPPHEAYLWGNPAILGGELLAASFLAEGWEMQAGGPGDIEELPVHKFKHEGEMQIKPCAEAWLSDRAGESIRGQGFIPVLSIKNRDTVRVLALQGLSGLALRLG